MTSLEQINKLSDRTEHFDWASHRMIHSMFDRDTEYKFGSVIWAISDSHIVPFGELIDGIVK